jgi:hypothetical protein
MGPSHPPASLRSEHDRIKSVVEMTRRGKRGKLKKPSFPLFPPRLQIRQKTPDSHISTAPAAGSYQKERTKK